MTPAPAPRISVVVPVYRDWERIPALLADLAAQTLPAADFEILLVDNDPGLGPPALALPPAARILPCAAPGAYAARNAGIAAARAGLIAFTDADCRPAPGWLKALAAAHAKTPEMLLAGPVRMIDPGPDPSAAACYDLLRGIPQERYLRRGYAATANLAAPAALLRALGGFDAARFSGGDAEFCLRARRAGRRLRLVPAAAVGHPCRTDWRALATKARRVKAGQVAGGSRRSRALWTLRTLTPPLRATARFLRAPAPLGRRLRAIAMLYALWGVELVELVRLGAGAPRERR